MGKNINTKSTGAQGILKPKSVIPREEGGLGFLIIMRAQSLSRTCASGVSYYIVVLVQ